MAAGIEVRHRTRCKVKPNGSGCNCAPAFRAVVFDKATGQRFAKTFTTEAAAKSWRRDAYAQLGRGDRAVVQHRLTLKEACDAWFLEARAGVVTTRSGDPYKPAALRSYEQSLRLHVYDTLGAKPFHTIRRVDVQALVDRLAVNGCAPASIQGPVTALRVVFRRALERGDVEVLPTQGVKLPAVRTRRERFASPHEAAQLIAAAPAEHRALWATAFYTGLRRGELLALKWDAVDFAAGTVDVLASWSPVDGIQATKNRGRRRVPIPTELRAHLAEHKMRQPPATVLVFDGATPDDITKKADAAWKKAKLNRITLHECRHSYASFMIAAGVIAKDLCDYLGHASITTTFDRYGHLMPGNETVAAEKLDSFLTAAAGG